MSHSGEGEFINLVRHRVRLPMTLPKIAQQLHEARLALNQLTRLEAQARVEALKSNTTKPPPKSLSTLTTRLSLPVRP